MSAVNRINPEKLYHSKWTSLQVTRNEKHFIVTKVIRDGDERIIACQLEAIINNNVYTIDWRQLKDSGSWKSGWI